jgi:hypothetical protein
VGALADVGDKGWDELCAQLTNFEACAALLPGPALVVDPSTWAVARDEHSDTALLRFGTRLLRLKRSALTTLRLSNAMPARSIGGYALVLGFWQTPGERYSGDPCYLNLPARHSTQNTLDLLRISLHVASLLDVLFDYEVFNDV